jgi:hypothetical protein
MRAAAALLSASGSVAGLADVVRAANLGGEPFSVDRRTREALGIAVEGRAELAAGVGEIRTLLLELPDVVSLRDALQQVARRLATRAPHVLWVVAAVDTTGAHAGLVAWTRESTQERLASFLWEPDHVVDSDAETLSALASIPDGEDVLLHARLVELLGRDALTRRFYRALESHVTHMADSIRGRADADAARHVALLYASRMLFLKFLEAKGWLNGERSFIASRFDDCMRKGGHFHQRVLLPLFFGTLNTPISRRAPAARAFGEIPFLNGGLFTRTAAERHRGRITFGDDTLGALLSDVFARFRFVAREDSSTWSEASVDPEMLGRAFESLMAAPERRTSGAYYTPHELVARVGERVMTAALPTPTLARVRSLRVLDPACGSGAFLVFVLERLADLRRQLGDPQPLPAIRREVLAHSIFGVDRNPTAVWLCELRLWLSVVIESDERDPARVPPLPNLDRNIRVGDALTGSDFSRAAILVAGSARLAEARSRYVRATGARKRTLGHELDRLERGRVLARIDRDVELTRHARRERLAVQRALDLFGRRAVPGADARRESRLLRDRLRTLRIERRRLADGGALPFAFGACFADAEANGGFDIVVGNPPWVRIHRIPPELRAHFRQRYQVYRSAAWQQGPAAGLTSPGFASQVDLSALFVERSLSLLRSDGALALLLPVKLWRSLAGGGVRDYLLRSATLLRLEDLSESRHAFDATAYPSLLVARAGGPTTSAITLAISDRVTEREWKVERSSFPFDDTAGAPWLALTPPARAAFERVRDAGIPLGRSPFGAPRLGVKSGCNSAFVVRLLDMAHGIATVVDADGERGVVEASLLRPALRGDSVQAWAPTAYRDWIVWTHDATGSPLAKLPERTNVWLRRRYTELTGRSDAARARRWWSLFRTEAADCRRHRVVWSDFGRRPRALVLPAGDPTVPLNTCYTLACSDPNDAWGLTSLLNSPLAAAWLNAIAEPARGGYRRYLAWTVGLLPLPRDWARAREILAAARSCPDDALLDATLHAYGLRYADVAALLDPNASSRRS